MNFVIQLLEIIMWPAVVLILGHKALSTFPSVVGAFGYKHLMLMTDIKETARLFTSFLPREVQGLLTDEQIEQAYDTMIINKHIFNLERFQDRYIDMYPKYTRVKLTRINMKAKTIEEKRKAIIDYSSDFNTIITRIASQEELRNKETLLQISDNLTKYIPLFK